MSPSPTPKPGTPAGKPRRLALADLPPGGSFVVDDDEGETAEIEADTTFMARLGKSIQQAKAGKTRTAEEVREALQIPKSVHMTDEGIREGIKNRMRAEHGKKK